MSAVLISLLLGIKRTMRPRIIISPGSYSFGTIFSRIRAPSKTQIPPRTSFGSCPSLIKLRPGLAAVPAAPPRFASYRSSCSSNCRSLTMATATKILLDPATDLGIYSSDVTADAARAASEVLQEDMESHHIFFNDEGFHSRFPLLNPSHILKSIYFGFYASLLD